jgi:hypothetical protein
MAGTTVDTMLTAFPGSSNYATTAALNKVVADLEVLRAGLEAVADAHNTAMAAIDADNGTIGTDYVANCTVTKTTFDDAADLTAPKVSANGTAIA